MLSNKPNETKSVESLYLLPITLLDDEIIDESAFVVYLGERLDDGLLT